MDATFYVYQPGTGYTKCEHPTQESAEREAERLALLNPGTEFAVLAKIATCVRREVSWERIGDLPF